MPRERGFLQEARKEINANPGQTAPVIVKRLLEDGRAKSAALNPEMSLAATLSKHYKDISVTRTRDQGVYRYYPSSYSTVKTVDLPEVTGKPSPQNSVTLELPNHCREAADALVTLGKFGSQKEALVWLISKGVESLRVN